MELLSSTEKSNLSINKNGEDFGTTSSRNSVMQAFSKNEALQELEYSGIVSIYRVE